jgi:hypothetical protein
MKNIAEPTEATRQYSDAYAAHYSARDLPLALRLYNAIVEEHSLSAEADYSRMQIRNIVTATVPPAKLLSAEIDLTRRYLQPELVRDS